MDVCFFVDGEERRAGQLHDINAEGKGRVQWKPALCSDFGASEVRLVVSGGVLLQPSIDKDGYTTQIFAKDSTYEVQLARGDQGWTLKQICGLGLPRPFVPFNMLSARSLQHHDEERNTHPTTVCDWNAVGEIKEWLRKSSLDWRASGYPAQDGPDPQARGDREASETDAMANLKCRAAARCNRVFERNHIGVGYAAHPSRQVLDSVSIPEEIRYQSLELYMEEDALNSATGLNDAPDLVAIAAQRPLGHVATLECKWRESLQGIREAGGSLAKGYRRYNNLEAAQEASDDVDMVPAEWSEDLLINVSRLVEQEYGYMARRGHLAGLCSCYDLTWAFKADGKGGLWISAPISFDSQASADTLSVVEAMLWAPLYNIANITDCNFKPFLTATNAGENPMTAEEAKKARWGALEKRQQEKHPQSDGGAGPSRPGGRASGGRTRSLPIFGWRLSRHSWTAMWEGKRAVCRVGEDFSSKEEVANEVAALERLSSVKGVLTPELLAIGVAGTMDFCCVEYLEGIPFNWWKHGLRFGQDLYRMLETAHKAGVAHMDPNENNFLIVDDKPYIVDWGNAQLDPPEEFYRQELRAMNDLISLAERHAAAKAKRKAQRESQSQSHRQQVGHSVELSEQEAPAYPAEDLTPAPVNSGPRISQGK